MVYLPECGLMVVINSCRISNISFEPIARATKNKVTLSKISYYQRKLASGIVENPDAGKQVQLH